MAQARGLPRHVFTVLSALGAIRTSGESAADIHMHVSITPTLGNSPSGVEYVLSAPRCRPSSAYFFKFIAYRLARHRITSQETRASRWAVHHSLSRKAGLPLSQSSLPPKPYRIPRLWLPTPRLTSMLLCLHLPRGSQVRHLHQSPLHPPSSHSALSDCLQAPA